MLLCIPCFAQSVNVVGTVNLTGTINLATGGGGGGGGTTIYNIDDITTLSTSPPGWSQCVHTTNPLTNCNPGGGGTFPPATASQSFHISSPSMDGASTVGALTTPTQSGGTNVLWTYKALVDDAAVQLSFDLYYYCDTSCVSYNGQLEFDQAIFAKTYVTPNTPNGTNFMFGSQCNMATGHFQIFNQAANTWVNATYSGGIVPCSVTANVWHHLQEQGHRIAGDTGSCSLSGKTYPCEYYDYIIQDGTKYVPTNTNLPASNLPASFGGVILIQFQLDNDGGSCGTCGNTTHEYLDNMNFTYQ